MANSALFWIFLSCLVFAILALRAARRRRLLMRERRWLPVEVSRARLVFAERLFVARNPALVARVDRAYEVDGEMRLVELKTRSRHRVYASDVIELSAQRTALEAATRRRVSRVGYVLTQTPFGERLVHRVILLSSATVTQLIARRAQLLDGIVKPRCTPNARLCASCPYRTECEERRTAVLPVQVRERKS